MNETDFIRQQLATERTHLREILAAVGQGPACVGSSRAVAAYLDWAGRRLVMQLRAQLAALPAAGTLGSGVGADHLAALEDTGAAPARAPRLLESLAAWGDELDGLAARTLRTGHWRQAAQLTADTILQERQLYAAARAAAGLP